MRFKSFLVIAIIAVFGGKLLKQQFEWANKNILLWDIREYYVYLPSAIIHHDLNLNYLDEIPKEVAEKYRYFESPIGKRIARMSMGMSVLYLPFFIYGHLTAIITGEPQTGFSEPYQWAIFITGYVYMLLGLLVLARVLQRYFTDLAVALTLFCVGMGTNLYYYSTIEGAMSHAPLFFLFACFLYLIDSWHQQQKWKHLIGIAIVVGLAALARPTSILILTVFFLYGILDMESLKAKFKLFHKHYRQLTVLCIILFFIALPQLLYWKMQAGQWIYYSYNDEGFFFNKPRILKGLFSFRKGWLIYTPLMSFALAGFFFKRYFQPQWLAVLIFIIINIYVVLSWWCWWYGGGFGMRSLVESYALLALPLAAFWEKIRERVFTFLPALAVAAFFIFVNLRQTEQYRLGMLHWESMSAKFYKETFLKLEYNEDARKYLDPPDYEAAKEGKSE